jgi:site-specific recombinase XerC
MTSHDSTTRGDTAKPKRPDGFPLFCHDSGRWAKKIRGKFHYFGYWRGPSAVSLEEARDTWLEQKDELLAGRTPRRKTGGLDVGTLVNSFLHAKKQKMAAGEMTQHTWNDYAKIGTRMIASFGRTRPVETLEAVDFATLRATLAKTLGPTRLGSDVQRVKTIFRWAEESGVIPALPRFGPDFKRPDKRIRRAARQAKGSRMWERKEILTILRHAKQPLRSMVLLAVNCGYGNNDVARLPLAALDLDAGWIDFPRPKTAIPRRSPLWPETVQALREWLAMRPEPRTGDVPDTCF